MGRHPAEGIEDEGVDDTYAIDLRGPCGNLMAKLYPLQAVVEFKCNKCSRRADKPIYHVFHLRIGRLIEDAAG